MMELLCPKCNGEMILRNGRNGEFYGCSAYFRTGCNGVRKVKKSVDDIDELFNEPEDNPAPVRVGVDVPEDDTNIELIPTKDYPHLKFKFEFFNPVQSRVFQFYDKGINCVVAAATSAGKTVISELFMADTISKGKKAVFLSPLKAVSQEKYDDWTDEEHGFSKRNVSIVTGDYSLTEKRVEELRKADVIIQTTEMLDSHSRRINTDKNNWLLEVGVLVIDECFLGGTRVLVDNNFSIPIEEIYDNHKIEYVLSYNEYTKTLEKKRIIRRIKKELDGGLVSIRYQVDGITYNLVCTPNHKIWTSVGYKRADDLNQNDVLKIFFEDKENFGCSCGKSFDNRSKFVNHYLKDHIRQNRYTYQCQYCNKKFSGQHNLTYHINHFHGNKIQCPLCTYSTTMETSLTPHLEEYHGFKYKKNYDKETQKFISVMQELENKKNDLIILNNVNCDFCESFFINDAAKEKHIRSSHFKYYPHELYCSICNTQFKDRSAYAKHCLHKHNEEYQQNVANGRKKINYVSLNSKRLATMRKNGALKKISENMIGDKNPVKRIPGLSKIIGEKIHNNFQKKSKEEQDKIRQNFINAPMRGRGKIWKPTRLEQAIIDMGIPDIAYTGDGKFWLNIGKKGDGRPWNKNPDFKIRGQRKVIEVGDTEYWHTMEEIEKVVKGYESKNFKCLYLTTDDYKEENWCSTQERIKTFVNNHDGIVVRVKRYGNGNINNFVYNLEIEDNHNYIANNVLVSNCHLITIKGRGDKAESALMRFSKQNPDCRIVLLSATMPNVSELSKWLTQLNGKKTELINSNYRPCQLDIHYEMYNNLGRYQQVEQNKIDKAIEIVKKFKDDKFIVFVHAKTIGKKIEQELKNIGEKVELHNAELTMKERNRVMHEFKDRSLDSLRIIVATSTLAWGSNFPARRVVIVGVHRGMSEVEPLDIKQMCGRSGRVGYDPKGDAHILLPQSKFSFYKKWCQDIPPITSTMNDKGTLAFHIVSEISEKEIYNVETLMVWYNRSLAAFQNNYLNSVDAQAVFDNLVKACIVEEKDGIYSITKLGRVASSLYFNPYSISGWYFNFNKVFKEFNVDDYHYSWALANISDNSNNFVQKDMVEDVAGYKNSCTKRGLNLINDGVASVGFLLYACLSGMDEVRAEQKYQVKYDIERTMVALEMIDTMHAFWGRNLFWKQLQLRIQYEVSARQTELCQLSGIGGVRVKKLFERGIETIKDFFNPMNQSKIKSVLGGHYDDIFSKNQYFLNK